MKLNVYFSCTFCYPVNNLVNKLLLLLERPSSQMYHANDPAALLQSYVFVRNTMTSCGDFNLST